MSGINGILSSSVGRRSLIGGGIFAAIATIAGWRMAGAEEDHDGEHWGYDGETGPDHWGELSEHHQTCATGERQSPINISPQNAPDVDLPNVELVYEIEHGFEIENNGHTVRVPIAGESFAVLDHEQFRLMEFHFHAPSEHAIEGMQEAMELHMVHAHSDDPTRKLVLGVLLSIGEEHEPLAPVFDHLPVEPDGLHAVDGTLDPAAFLPASQQSFRYAGSLTTPPCTEGVSWVIFSERVEVSLEQANHFLAIYDGNARPFRDGDNRDVVEDTSP